jgi:protein-disulfide isomerase
MRTAPLKVLCATFVLGYISLGCVAKTTQSANTNETVAVVNGQPIREDELLPAVRSQLQQLRTQEYQIKSQALETLIRDKVLQAEAQKRGLTVDKLLDQEIQPILGDIDDAQIQSAYDAQKASLGGRPLAEVKDQLRQSLKRQQIRDAKQEFADFMVARANVSILLKPPRIEVAVDPARVKGSPNAPVTIVEFSDFECPYCKAAEPTVKHVIEKYDGKVRLAYRDLPIRGSHPHADAAAEAAHCAAEQGKFWEYHDRLFAEQSKLDSASLKEDARSVGLDEGRFDACVASHKFQAKVQQDADQAFEAGITGTPGFFINGILLNGAQPSAAFERIIDSELKNAHPAQATP